MTLTIDDMWWNLDAYKVEKQYRNCTRFIVMLNSLPKQVANGAYFPNQELAPWHVQFNFGALGVISVWPHVRKFQLDGDTAMFDDEDWTNLSTLLRSRSAKHYALTGQYFSGDVNETAKQD